MTLVYFDVALSESFRRTSRSRHLRTGKKEIEQQRRLALEQGVTDRKVVIVGAGFGQRARASPTDSNS